MDDRKITIHCVNTGHDFEVAMGSTLQDIYPLINISMEYGPISAKVNNKVEGMHYRLYHNKDVEFLDLHDPSAMRSYTRTLFFVLSKAVHDLYPTSHVIIDIPVSNGFNVNLSIGHNITPADVEAIKAQMQKIIDAAIPVKRHTVHTSDAINLFDGKGDKAKAKLLRSTGRLYTTYYSIDDYVDFYYGSMLTNTAQLRVFDLVLNDGSVLLRIPSTNDPSQLGPFVSQDKMVEVFHEHHRWQQIIGLRTVGDLNEAIQKGYSTQLINVSEALQEKKIVNMAEQIAERKNVKLVLLAGPSSSGKTTTCKRLSVQLLANGIKPLQISLDDYFVDRHHTPKDAKGEYDYESIYALNLPLINKQFNALFNGEEIELPKYNFQSGTSEPSGKKLHMEKDNILVVEGIHALNPELTSKIPEELKYRIYASALTTILLDDHNYIPTTDNRLLRRIIRDYKYRGTSARETIHRWPSVRAGENKWIFPYQERADSMFNTAMLFELAVIKTQAEPMLQEVPEDCEEYSEAYRLLKFLSYFKPVPYHNLPPTSLLREFLGGSSFKY